MAEDLPDILVTEDVQSKIKPAPASSSPPSSPKSALFYDAHEYTHERPATSDQPSTEAPVSHSGKDQEPPLYTNGVDSAGAEALNKEPPFSPRLASAHSTIDPLSEHIRQRASPQTQRSRRASANGTDPASPVAIRDETPKKRSVDVPRAETFGSATKEKKKAVPFLNLFRPGKKKEPSPEQSILDPEEVEPRPEGAQAQLFYESVDYMGFSPKHPQPPRYIKVHAQGKKRKDFNRLFLAQELKDREPHPDISRTSTFSSTSRLSKTKVTDAEATWALEFSRDGKYLATGGQDKLVRIWATLSSREDRRAHEKDEEAQENPDGLHDHLSAPVFRSKPFRIYEGHSSPVLDLSWSKNNFLLSSSMDKTVRLWHVSRDECLCTFKHTDFVTSILFHPKDDRFFLAGSLDSKLRLWSIPDKSVAYSTSMPEMCTAVAFTPDGKTAIAGCLTGLCLFYETDGLSYQTQIHAKSTYGKNARGSKITGIQAINMPPSNPHGDVKVLITSNDSRIRMYNLRDKSLEMKFKGNENTSSQIHARFNDDAKYIICGSEDKKVFIWSLGATDPEKKVKRPVEFFEAHNAATTVCAFAPNKTRQLLSNSEDPIYDICNPPPVTLMSRSEVESINSSQHHDDAGSIQPTPATAEGNGSFKRTEESPAYLARASHVECSGNIIVTADVTGCIKVFRYDCAAEKRPRQDSVTRRFSAVGALRRHSSMATQGSSRSRSRQGSNPSQPSRERILSWRQSIGNGNNGFHDSPKISPNPESTRRNGSPRLPVGGKFSYRSLLSENGGTRASPRAQASPSASASGLAIITSTPSTPGSQSPPDATTSARPGSSSSPSKSYPQPDQTGDANSTRPGRSGTASTTIRTEPPDNPLPHHDGTGSDHDSPVVKRQNSLEYWRYDAWRDTLVAQIEEAKHSPPRDGKPGLSERQPSLSSIGAPASASAASDHLRRPSLLNARGSTVSSISVLSSELSSASGGEGEGRGAALDKSTTATTTTGATASLGAAWKK